MKAKLTRQTNTVKIADGGKRKQTRRSAMETMEVKVQWSDGAIKAKKGAVLVPKTVLQNRGKAS
jgi:hypothetical protein